MRSLHLTLLVAGLLALAMGLFLYKWLVLGFPIHPDKQVPSWNLEIRVSLEAEAESFRASLYVPSSEGRFGLVDERYYSGGTGRTTGSDKGQNRRVTWSSSEKSGRVNLYYKTDVFRFSNPVPESDGKAAKPSDFLEAEDYLKKMPPAREEAVRALKKRIDRRSADQETFILQLAKDLSDEQISELESYALSVSKGKAESLKRAEVMGLLLRMQGTPTRVVTGFDLSRSGRKVSPVYWLEIWRDEAWRSVNVRSGLEDIPDTYLAWYRGWWPAASVTGGRLRGVNIAIAEQSAPQVSAAMAFAEVRDDPLFDFTLFGLPVETQQVYKILLTVPLGALVLILLRQIVGFKTFGTFMPVLIALALRETGLVAGVLLFGILVAIGLLFRFYFERLRLLTVPRLSAVLIVVVILMIFSSIVLEKIQVGGGLSIALFPLVILAMTIERMSVVWEEYGPSEALLQGGGSLLAATLAFFAMNTEVLGFLLFIYPELLLVILAISLMMGRYTGYRLTELYRFRSLAKK